MYHANTHIHFVGIGGIGMSGIAAILKQHGYKVSGCDAQVTHKNVTDLKNQGVAVYHGNNNAQCHDNSINFVVYSTAIALDHPELQAARKRGIPTVHRSHMLAEIMRTKFSIGIAGCHGKTTTTALTSHIFIQAGYDPTCVIGGNAHNLNTNAQIGTGHHVIVEADESDRSLLNLRPTTAVITNVDLDHLETYQDLDDIQQTFAQFLNNLPFYGKATVCADDPNSAHFLTTSPVPVTTFGLSKDADLQARNIILHDDSSEFLVWDNQLQQSLGTIQLAMPGNHNILNALAAMSVARDYAIPFETITAALKTFSGIERRFSCHGLFNGADIFDDYGHHPQEIMHTLRVARKRCKNKLTVVFQPHRYSRTYRLWHEFINVFTDQKVDNLIITDIYSAHEQPIEGITGKSLCKALKSQNPPANIQHIPDDNNFTAIKNYLDTITEPGDLVLFLGAGSIYQVATALVTPMHTANQRPSDSTAS